VEEEWAGRIEEEKARGLEEGYTTGCVARYGCAWYLGRKLSVLLSDMITDAVHSCGKSKKPGI
jgi:hypothetical protein